MAHKMYCRLLPNANSVAKLLECSLQVQKGTGSNCDCCPDLHYGVRTDVKPHRGAIQHNI